MKMNPNFVMKKIDDDYVLIPVGQASIDTKGLLRTNEVGYSIYNYLKEGSTFDELIEHMVADYNAPAELIKKDTIAFIEKLMAFKVIE